VGAADLTSLLRSAQDGDTAAMEALFEESYPLLSQLARARLRAHQRTPTLDTGSLVHEAYLRFASSGRLRIEDSLHFRRWAARVMRSVIVDLARRRNAARRGGGQAPVTISSSDLPAPDASNADQILRLHDALEAVASIDPRAAQVVELRYFAGMTEPEVAEALGVTERTVRRDWQKARLMLGEMLKEA
jgi:RNA polymerase sigma factor (TIGR02999 family)